MEEVKINSFKDAEEAAERWASSKHQKVKEMSFDKIWKEGDIWLVEGNITLKQGIFGLSQISKSFNLQVASNSGEVVGYKF